MPASGGVGPPVGPDGGLPGPALGRVDIDPVAVVVELEVAGRLVEVEVQRVTPLTLIGKVVDAEGSPLPGANACLIVDGVPGFCTTTNSWLGNTVQ